MDRHAQASVASRSRPADITESEELNSGSGRAPDELHCCDADGRLTWSSKVRRGQRWPVISFLNFLLGFIILVELRRNARTRKADFLSALSAAFILVYFVAPTILLLTPDNAPILSKFFWMKDLPSEDALYLWAAGLVGASYLSVLAGYLAGPQRKTIAPAQDSSDTYLIVGIVFLVMGIAVFFLFWRLLAGR